MLNGNIKTSKATHVVGPVPARRHLRGMWESVTGLCYLSVQDPWNFLWHRRESCRSSEIGNPCESSAVCNTSNVGSSLCALCTGAWGRQLPLDDVEQGLTPEDCAGRKGVVWAMQQASKEAQESILQAVSCEAQRNLGVPRKALQDGRVGEEQGMRTAQPLASLRPGFSVPALSWFSPTSSILDF